MLDLRQNDGSLLGLLTRPPGEGRTGTQLLDRHGEHGVFLGRDVEKIVISSLGQVVEQVGGALETCFAADRLPGQELGEGLTAWGIGNPPQQVDGLETRRALLLQRQWDQEVGHRPKIHVKTGQEQHKITSVVLVQAADERRRNPRPV